jgi:hypothetical protein
MKVTAKILITLALGCFLISARAQTEVEVSAPALTLQNGKVHIDFDLMNTAPSEKFTIRIEITTESGERVPAQTLTGDIGKGVSGGKGKTIIWDIEKDQVFLDEEIYVEVYALPETPPAAVVPPETDQEDKEALTEEKPSQKQEAARTAEQKEFNRTSLIIQSIAFPGLGLSRLTGNPHWIKGVAAYGCLGASVYLNRKAWSDYQAYLDPEDPGNKQDLFDNAYNLQKTARIPAYAALGIWVADLVWTIVGTSDMNSGQHAHHVKGFSIGTGVEPVSNIPMVALRYQF